MTNREAAIRRYLNIAILVRVTPDVVRVSSNAKVTENAYLCAVSDPDSSTL
jgi:hypothetical protein